VDPFEIGVGLEVIGVDQQIEVPCIHAEWLKAVADDGVGAGEAVGGQDGAGLAPVGP
jgi:hypothetical protein